MADTTDTNESATTEIPASTEGAEDVAVKDLDYYAAHPEEIPSDAREIDDLAQDIGAPEEASEEISEEAPEEDEGSGNTEKADQNPRDSKQDVDTASSGRETVILSKDGKKELPYSALVSEREKARRANRLVEQMGAHIQALEAKLASGQEEGKSDAPPESPKLDFNDETIQQMAVDFPAIGQLLKYSAGLEKKLANVEDRFQAIEQAERERQEAARRAEQDEVRALVDANPHLLYYEQHAPERWEAAIEADNALKKLNPGLSTKERLEKVVQVVELVMGETDLPPEFAAMKTTPVPAKPNMDEAIRQVQEAKRKPPVTLGEISGGNPPAPDELEEIVQRRPEELERLTRENPKRMQALLKRFG